MPSGSTHDRITLWSAPIITVCAYLLFRNGGLTLLVLVGFLFSGLMFGPDLDIYSVQFKRWGLVRWIWVPYQKTMKHRSLFSHGFLLGTCGRLLYIGVIAFGVAVLAMAIAQIIGNFYWNWHQSFRTLAMLLVGPYRGEAIALFVGLESGAMSHTVSDVLGSYWKKRQRRRAKSVSARLGAKKNLTKKKPRGQGRSGRRP